MDPALHRLIQRAGINTSAYTRDLYFRDCVLNRNRLEVPNDYQRGLIERCFLADLRKVVSDLELVITRLVPVRREKPSAFKKGYVPPVQGDML